jgi:hypothetical protein
MDPAALPTCCATIVGTTGEQMLEAVGDTCIQWKIVSKIIINTRELVEAGPALLMVCYGFGGRAEGASRHSVIG